MWDNYTKSQMAALKFSPNHKALMQVRDAYGNITKGMSLDNAQLTDLKKLADGKHQVVSKALIDSVLLVLLQRPQSITDEAFNRALDWLDRDWRRENV